MKNLIKKVGGWRSSTKRTWLVTLLVVNFLMIATRLVPPIDVWTWVSVSTYLLSHMIWLFLLSPAFYFPITFVLGVSYALLQWIFEDDKSRKRQQS